MLAFIDLCSFERRDRALCYRYIGIEQHSNARISQRHGIAFRIAISTYFWGVARGENCFGIFLPRRKNGNSGNALDLK
jgi:hypothetical protein